MSIFGDVFGGRSLDALVQRARRLTQSGQFEAALALVEKGLGRYPDAQALRDLGHQVRRGQARAAIQGLMARVDGAGEPAAFEQLIALYRDVGMPEEMVRLTDRYVREHGELESAQRLRGEQLLDAFFEDLRARDGRAAIDHLVRAALIAPAAPRPRLLLAEIYFAIGADRALAGQADALERMAGEDEVLRAAVAAMREPLAPAPKAEAVDALLARVEVSGALARDPSTWSSRPRKGLDSEHDAARVRRSLERIVREGHASEAVAIDRAGAVLATAGGTGEAAENAPEGPGEETGEEAAESALAGVARAVARTVKTQARELDLGRFRRCVVEGPFGVIVVEDAAGGVVAASGRRGTDASRLAERLSVAADGGRGRSAT